MTAHDHPHGKAGEGPAVGGKPALWKDGARPADLPNVIRCRHCGVLLLIDLLGEGFDSDEVAARRRTHADICVGAA